MPVKQHVLLAFGAYLPQHWTETIPKVISANNCFFEPRKGNNCVFLQEISCKRGKGWKHRRDFVNRTCSLQNRWISGATRYTRAERDLVYHVSFSSPLIRMFCRLQNLLDRIAISTVKCEKFIFKGHFRKDYFLTVPLKKLFCFKNRHFTTSKGFNLDFLLS